MSTAPWKQPDGNPRTRRWRPPSSITDPSAVEVIPDDPEEAYRQRRDEAAYERIGASMNRKLHPNEHPVNSAWTDSEYDILKY